LLVLGIIFIVSPGWILGLYWMRYQKLPWEKEQIESHEDSQTQDVQSDEKSTGERIITEEERITLLAKNDLFQEFPYDLTKEFIETTGIQGKDIEKYTFHDTYLQIKGEIFEFTNHTEMYRNKRELEIEDGLAKLKSLAEIDHILYTKQGRYVELIVFK